MFGYTEQELRQVGRNGVVDPSDTRLSEALEERKRTGKFRGELTFIRKDGTKLPGEISTAVLKDKNGATRTSMIIRDITERKKADEVIKRSESKYRKLHESMRDGFAFVGMDGMIKEFNESYRQMIGYTPEELLMLTYRDITPEKWHAFEQNIVEQQVLARGYSEVYEKEYLKRDGTIFPVELRTFLIKDETGGNIGMWAIVRDISERKRAEKELREGETRYRSLFENMLNGFAYCKMLFEDNRPRDFIYLLVNHAFEQLTGLKDVVGKKVSEVIPGLRESDPELFEIYGRVSLTGVPEKVRDLYGSIEDVVCDLGVQSEK